jgi:hypothetical protein
MHQLVGFQESARVETYVVFWLCWNLRGKTICSGSKLTSPEARILPWATRYLDYVNTGELPLILAVISTGALGMLHAASIHFPLVTGFVGPRLG